jgi:hypothetical protein
MAPVYSLGDYVGGKKRYSNQINHVVDMNCIIQLQEHSTIVRRIKNGTAPDIFNLFCINPDADVQEPVMCDLNILFAAPIIWHRKKDP